MEAIGCIYITTCIPNGKIYVGRHEYDHRDNYYLGSGTLLRKAINKYGKNNFKRKILRECYSLHELRIWEHFYIKKYKSQDKSIGYNIANGDVNSTEYNPAKLPEVREKIKARIKERGGLSGENNPMSGKHWTSFKRKQMLEMFENKPPMLGKKHSEETKRRWSEKRRGKDPFANLSEKRKKEIFAKNAGKNNAMWGTRFIWINNGIENKRGNISEPIPKGWKKGMIR